MPNTETQGTGQCSFLSSFNDKPQSIITQELYLNKNPLQYRLLHKQNHYISSVWPSLPLRLKMYFLLFKQGRFFIPQKMHKTISACTVCLHSYVMMIKWWKVICYLSVPSSKRRCVSPVKPHCQSVVDFFPGNFCLIPFKPQRQSPYPIILPSIPPQPLSLSQVTAGMEGNNVDTPCGAVVRPSWAAERSADHKIHLWLFYVFCVFLAAEMKSAVRCFRACIPSWCYPRKTLSDLSSWFSPC